MAAELPPGEPSFWLRRVWWRRVASTSLGVWVATAFAFASTVVAARALGPTEYGAVALALAAALVVQSLLDITLEEGMVHHGFQALEAGDVRGVRALVRVGVCIDLAIGLAVSALIVALAEPIADLASAGRLDPTLMRLAGLFTLTTCMDGVTGAVLLLADRPDLRGWTMTAGNFARVVATVIAVKLGGPEALLVAYAAAAAVGAAIQAATAWHVGWRRWHGSPRPGDFRRWSRTLLPFGVHSSLSTTLISAGDTLVPVVLGRIAGTRAVGLFRVAQLPQTLAALVSAPARIVLFPEQSKLVAAGRVDELERSVWSWSKVGVAVTLPLAAGGMFLLPWLIPTVYGPGFQGAVTPAQILIGAAFVSFAFMWMKSLPAAIGRPHYRSLLAVISLMVGLPLTILLAPGHGAAGAAVGVSAAGITAAALHFVLVIRYFGERRGETSLAGTPCLGGHQPDDARYETVAVHFAAPGDSGRAWFVQERRCVDCGERLTRRVPAFLDENGRTPLESVSAPAGGAQPLDAAAAPA
jgi:O-antigen/teichoic acid export membrane protein